MQELEYKYDFLDYIIGNFNYVCSYSHESAGGCVTAPIPGCSLKRIRHVYFSYHSHIFFNDLDPDYDHPNISIWIDGSSVSCPNGRLVTYKDGIPIPLEGVAMIRRLEWAINIFNSHNTLEIAALFHDVDREHRRALNRIKSNVRKRYARQIQALEQKRKELADYQHYSDYFNVTPMRMCYD